MSRTTKIGLWLVPWCPALLTGVAIYAWFQPSYETSTFVQLNADGTTTWTDYDSTFYEPLSFHPTFVSVTSLLIALAFVVGVILLLISLGRRLLRQRASSV